MCMENRWYTQRRCHDNTIKLVRPPSRCQIQGEKLAAVFINIYLRRHRLQEQTSPLWLRLAKNHIERHGMTDRPTGSAASSGDLGTDALTVRIERTNPDYDLLRQESVRLSTFDDWPVSAFVQPSALARAGLFYIGEGDRTRCAFCRGVLHHCEPYDNPDLEHLRHFPNCPFVCQRDVGSGSIGPRQHNIFGDPRQYVPDTPFERQPLRRQASSDR